jgi:hypothetical protein
MSYVRGKSGSNFGDALTDIGGEKGASGGYAYVDSYGPNWEGLSAGAGQAASGQLSTPESGSYETPDPEATYVDPDPETSIYAEKQPVAEPDKVPTEQQQQEPPPMTDPAPPVGKGSVLPLIAGAAIVAYLLVR